MNFRRLSQKKHKSLSTINFSTDDILKIIRNFDSNKAHRHDIISIQMIKICDTSIGRPPKLIFQSCLNSEKLPIKWKKASVVPVHKKSDKQILKNYRPILLLPIAGKIFERLLYDRMFEFFIENNLISKNQSGLTPCDFCINQLLSITHEIYQSLKSDSHPTKKILFICFNKSPLKVMKNAFYFILKALFVLKIFTFLSWHFGHVEEMA